MRSEPEAYTLSGSIASSVSPQTQDEGLDQIFLRRLLAFSGNNSTDAIFPLGTCGEGPSLRDRCQPICCAPVCPMEPVFPKVLLKESPMTLPVTTKNENSRRAASRSINNLRLFSKESPMTVPVTTSDENGRARE